MSRLLDLLRESTNPAWSMTDRLRLWHYQADWPADSHGRIFLPRGILRFGSLIDGKWTGGEPAVEHRKALPEHLLVGTSVEDQYYAASLLNEIDPNYRNRSPWSDTPTASGRSLLLSNPMPTNSEWSLAHLESVKRSVVTEAMLRRYHFVCAMMQMYLQNGSIRSSRRSLHGDGFTMMPATDWIGEKLQFRFDLARFNVASPFDAKAAQMGDAWVFVSEEDAENCGRECRSFMDARVAAAQAVSASKQQVDEFFHWLVGEMKRNLERKPMPKDEFKRKAKAQFGVGDRKFEECWAGAIAETGATSWSRSGAPRGPRKSPRKSSHDK